MEDQQYVNLSNGQMLAKKEKEPAQSLPLLVEAANNPPLSDTSDADDIHPEVRKFFEDNPITRDHLTKPKYATALPVPPDLVEKYFIYKQNKQKKIVSDQSSPPPKEPAVSAKSTTSTGELCKIKSKEKMKPSPPRSSGKRAAKVHKKAPKVK